MNKFPSQIMCKCDECKKQHNKMETITMSRGDVALAFKTWFEKYKSNPSLFGDYDSEDYNADNYADECATYFLELLRFSNEF